MIAGRAGRNIVIPVTAEAVNRIRSGLIRTSVGPFTHISITEIRGDSLKSRAPLHPIVFIKRGRRLYGKIGHDSVIKSGLPGNLNDVVRILSRSQHAKAQAFGGIVGILILIEELG